MKPSHVGILRYAERVREMHDLAKYLSPPSVKCNIYEADNWKVCDQEFMVSEIRVAIKYGLPSSMQYELDYNQEDYRSLVHENWCDLLSTIQVKDDSKRVATHINKIAYTIASSLSDSDRSVRIPRKKKARLRAGVLRSNKGTHKNAPNHHGT